MACRTLTTAALLAAALAVTQPAHACRLYAPRTSELAAHTIVVVATIESATRVPSTRWNSWSMTARKLKAIAGSPMAGPYSFQATLSSSGCGETPLPVRGEKWVLYLNRSGREVTQALPLALAKEHDPRIRGIR